MQAQSRFSGFPVLRPKQRKRAAPIFVTGWRPRERLSAARRGDYRDGYCRSENHPVVLARHSLQQAGAVPGQRPAREGRRLDRGAGRGHRPAHAASEPQRPAAPQCRRHRDRHVRDSGRRPPLPGARTAGQAEAPRQDRARALRRARSGDRHPRRGRLARREHPARAAPSARPVSRLPGHARERPLRGGHRRGVLHHGQHREAAPAARQRLAETARHLCRRRHVAGAVDGLHRQHRSRPPGAGLGGNRRLLVEGALSDPPNAHRENRPRL